MQSDVLRFHELLLESGEVKRLRKLSLLLTPTVATLALYRVSHYCLQRNWSALAGLLYRLNITLTGADIHPLSRIGAGCLIAHPVGVVIFGTLGEQVSVYARVIVAPDLLTYRLEQAPRIGPGVVLGAMASVIGKVEVAARTHVAPCSLIDFSIDTPDSMIRAQPSRPISRPTTRKP